jgi:hypothetical protein
MATEAAPPAADKAEEDDTDTSPPGSYVSPVSNDHKEGKGAGQSSPDQPIRRGTINNISSQNSSDSEIPLAPSVYQFVPPNIYDSDASDGRCVCIL